MFLAGVGIGLSACTVSRSCKMDCPQVCIPDQFAYDQPGVQVPADWWTEFDLPEMDVYLQQAFSQNLTLEQAWARLSQAKATAIIRNAPKYPTLDYKFKWTREERRKDSSTSSPTESSSTNYTFGADLKYEVDLWKRIDSEARAACYDYYASMEDLEATALTLSGSVVDTWFTILEKLALIDIINEQIKVNETFLELIELRFHVGQASALNIYQQRLQLEDSYLQMIPVRVALENAKSQLAVLGGTAPHCEDVEISKGIPLLPLFPELEVPLSLLSNRPDIRRAFDKVEAADYELAAAIADRLPRLTIPISYEMKGKSFSSMIDDMLFKVAADLVQPVLDGGKRQAEVMKRRAVLCERLSAYSQAFIIAVKEVEDAVYAEKMQLELLDRIYLELDLARKNLREAKSEFENGVVEYLTVIAAIQRLQRLQQLEITERIKLLKNRANLYRALGGSCITRCCQS